MKARLALAVLVSLLTCLVSEGALRLATGPLFPSSRTYFRPWMSFDPVFSWRNVPGFALGTVERSDGKTIDARINSLGFRGPEIPGEKPDGVLRIVCLGDSGTFGMVEREGVGGDHDLVVSYSEELRRVIERERLAHVQVINAGVIGYSSSHGLRQLLLKIVELDPDVVTFRFGVNDEFDAFAPALRADEPAPGLRRALFYGFHEWKLFRVGLFAYQGIPWLHAEKNSVVWAPRYRFGYNAQRFIEVARDKGFHLLFMDYPLGESRGLSPWSRSKGKTDQAVRALYERVKRGTHDRQKMATALANAEGIPVLRTARAFLESEVSLFHAVDYVHPNIRGAALTAELLFKKLDELGWLAEPGP